MQRAIGIGGAYQGRGGGAGVGQMLPPGAHPLAVFERGRVLIQTLTKELLKRLRHASIVAGRNRGPGKRVRSPAEPN